MSDEGAAMPINDLSGISGLDARQRAVLAQKLDMTSCYELIMTDRQRIVDAFGRRTIRPTLEDVAVWQDEARHLRASSIDASVAASPAPGWEPAASFVVAFEERRQGAALERRIVAEQTEVEPEASPQQRSQWPDWACDDAWRWVLEQVGASAASASFGRAPITSAAEAAAAGTRGAGAGSKIRTTERCAKIDIERAHLADSQGDIELVAGSSPVPQHRLVWTQPARLFITLGSSPTRRRTSVVLQLGRVGGQKQAMAGHLDDMGRVAAIELSGLSDGEYKPAIVAWTPDGSSLPRVVKLPTVEVIGLGIGPGSSP